jgi:GNAT superfamily N-acetyltransferase
MFTISRATPNDADSLTAIAISAKRHWNYPEAWIQHWIPSLTISEEYISQNETWVAILQETCTGFYSLKNEIQDLYLDNLWVLPEYIGKGIGKQLFNHALERCKILGASTLKINADPNAQTFYEKMGAKKVAEHHSDLFGEDRVLPIMEIHL